MLKLQFIQGIFRMFCNNYKHILGDVKNCLLYLFYFIYFSKKLYKEKIY